jgi:hypothetical protein
MLKMVRYKTVRYKTVQLQNGALKNGTHFMLQKQYTIGTINKVPPTHGFVGS